MPLIRAVALNVIKSLVPLNLPGAEVVRMLQQLHITYKRTTMLADIRVAFDRVKYESRITALKPDAVIPDAWMNTEDMGAPYNYRVHLKVTNFDEASGEYITEHKYMFEDDLKSVGDYADDFPDYSAGTSDPEGVQYAGAQVVGVTKNMRVEPAPF